MCASLNWSEGHCKNVRRCEWRLQKDALEWLEVWRFNYESQLTDVNKQTRWGFNMGRGGCTP